MTEFASGFHGPCLMEDCGSSDGAYRYASGWIRCFSCGKNYPNPDNPPEGSFTPKTERKPVSKDFIQGDYQALRARGISEEVAKKFHYATGKVPEDYKAKRGSVLDKLRGKTVQIENFYDGKKLVGQKVRGRNKEFATIGNVSESLFGRHCSPAGGKMLVVTEGAIDAMSYSEVRKNWPAVSIPAGADGAKKAISANLEYLESFDKVVFCFDNDDAGRSGIESIKGLLTPGKMHVAYLTGEFKDLNEALLAGDYKSIMNAVYEAEEVRPDGIVQVEDVLEEAMTPVEWGLPWFLPSLTKITYGRRYGEVYALGAGTGVGKTDLFTEQVAYDVMELGLNVGLLFLEQKPVETVKRLAGKIGNRRFHIPDAGWTPEELVESVKPLKGKVTMYDSFGQTEWDQVKMRIRHMALGAGIRIFYLDHLTAMADTKDEKGSLEQIMKEMAGLANELNIIIHFISHLTTPDGTPHEEGGRVMVRHFKGSRAIGFWSFFMFGMERDQQAEDMEERQTTTFRVLKDRYTGQATGEVIYLRYQQDTGRLVQSDEYEPNEQDMKDAADGF